MEHDINSDNLHLVKHLAQALISLRTAQLDLKAVTAHCLDKDYTTCASTQKILGHVREYGVQADNIAQELADSMRHIHALVGRVVLQD